MKDNRRFIEFVNSRTEWYFETQNRLHRRCVRIASLIEHGCDRAFSQRQGRFARQGCVRQNQFEGDRSGNRVRAPDRELDLAATFQIYVRPEVLARFHG